jgi:hypothetical protein
MVLTSFSYSVISIVWQQTAILGLVKMQSEQLTAESLLYQPLVTAIGEHFGLEFS